MGRGLRKSEEAPPDSPYHAILKNEEVLSAASESTGSTLYRHRQILRPALTSFTSSVLALAPLGPKRPARASRAFVTGVLDFDEILNVSSLEFCHTQNLCPWVLGLDLLGKNPPCRSNVEVGKNENLKVLACLLFNWMLLIAKGPLLLAAPIMIVKAVKNTLETPCEPT